MSFQIRTSDHICPKCLDSKVFWDGEDWVECTTCETDEHVELFDDIIQVDSDDWAEEIDGEEFDDPDQD